MEIITRFFIWDGKIRVCKVRSIHIKGSPNMRLSEESTISPFSNHKNTKFSNLRPLVGISTLQSQNYFPVHQLIPTIPKPMSTKDQNN